MNLELFIHQYVDSDYKPGDPLPFTVDEWTIPKHTILTDYGQVERKAYFLLKGIAKISMIRQDGEERVLEFFFPGQFFSAYSSFLNQKPSDVQVKVLTEAHVQVLTHESMQAAYAHSLLANKLGRLAAEFYYIRKTQREKDFLTKTASERYLDLLHGRPELVQQIPIQMIAKYLGVTAESLSRIRKAIS